MENCNLWESEIDGFSDFGEDYLYEIWSESDFLLQNQLMGAYRHTLNDKLLLNYGRQKQTPSPVFPSTPSKSSN